MDRKFIFISTGGLTGKTIYNDIIKRPDVIYIQRYTKNETRLDKAINRIIRLYTAGEWYSGLFSCLKNFSFKRTQLSTIKFDENTKYYISFAEGLLTTFSASHIQSLHKKNIRPVLSLMNPISTVRPSSIKKFKYFGDYVFSFDEGDARRNGYMLNHHIYSKVFDNSEIIPNKDIYFIGAAKERMSFIMDIYEYLSGNGVKCDFNIVGAKKNEQTYKEEINYCKNIPYEQTLKEMFNSKCILELLQKGQEGATLRYYEAVCYNKKLLTNNKNVINLPFYNPEYIKVFENVDDIDIEWIKTRGEIDYGYDGSFSPVHMLEELIEFDTKKENEIFDLK